MATIRKQMDIRHLNKSDNVTEEKPLPGIKRGLYQEDNNSKHFYSS